jgi:hypothetical protein
VDNPDGESRFARHCMILTSDTNPSGPFGWAPLALDNLYLYLRTFLRQTFGIIQSLLGRPESGCYLCWVIDLVRLARQAYFGVRCFHLCDILVHSL